MKELRTSTERKEVLKYFEANLYSELHRRNYIGLYHPHDVNLHPYAANLHHHDANLHPYKANDPEIIKELQTEFRTIAENYLSKENPSEREKFISDVQAGIQECFNAK